MIVCDNCRAFVAILLGAASLDGWPVLVNARLSAREIDEIRDHCGARRVFYTTSVSPHATAHAKRHDAVITEVAGFGWGWICALYEKIVLAEQGEERAGRDGPVGFTYCATTLLP